MPGSVTMGVTGAPTGLNPGEVTFVIASPSIHRTHLQPPATFRGSLPPPVSQGALPCCPWDHLVTAYFCGLVGIAV